MTSSQSIEMYHRRFIIVTNKQFPKIFENRPIQSSPQSAGSEMFK